jgi:hypothetical protein
MHLQKVITKKVRKKTNNLDDTLKIAYENNKIQIH